MECNNAVIGCHLISDVVNVINHPAVTYHTLKYRVKLYCADPSKFKRSTGGFVCPKYVGVPVSSCGDDISREDNESNSDMSSTYKQRKPLAGRAMISPTIRGTVNYSLTSCDSSDNSSNLSMTICLEKAHEESKKAMLEYRLLRRKDMDLHQLYAVAIQNCDSPMK